MMAAAKRKSAFFSATQEAQKQVEQENTVKTSDSSTVVPSQSETVTQPQSETVIQTDSKTVSEPQGDALPSSSSVTASPSSSAIVAFSQSETVTQYQSKGVIPLNSSTVKKEVKVSFYLTPEEEQKLDDLAYEHKKRTGKRINRNDIVRHLVDNCSIEDLRNLR
jgi:hypothetical protein